MKLSFTSWKTSKHFLDKEYLEKFRYLVSKFTMFSFRWNYFSLVWFRKQENAKGIIEQYLHLKKKEPEKEHCVNVTQQFIRI